MDFGSPGEDRGQAVAVDGNDNVIATGYFAGTVDFGGGPFTSAHLPWLDANQYQDVFVAKHGSGGVHLWSRQIGAEGNDRGYDVATDASGNGLVTGAVAGSIDFGNGQWASTLGGLDAFLVKYSGFDGSYGWSRRMGGNQDDAGYGVAVDGSGSVIVTGYWQRRADFGGGPVTSAGSTDATGNGGSIDVFVAKYSGVDGSHVWSKPLGGAGSDYGVDVACDSAGNVIALGRFQSTVDFGGGPLASLGGTDNFVAKYSATDGSHLWSRAFGGTLTDLGHSLAVDAAGNVYVVGDFQGTVNFGGEPLTSAGSYDIFLAKYSGVDGQHLWSKRFGSTGFDTGLGITVNAGEPIVTGGFEGTVTFGGAPLTAASIYDDIFVARYSASGAHLRSQRFGGTLGQYGNSVASRSDGNAMLTGFFENSLDFSVGPLSSTGGFDIFVASIAP